MKTNIKHGIIFADENLVQVRGQIAVLSNPYSNFIVSFLKDGYTNIVSLDSSSYITWNVTNRRNKLFLEYDDYNNVLPLTIETDGSETIRSGKTLPKTASNGSLFYHIIEDKIYVRINNVWEGRSVVLIADVLGMRVISKSAGAQTATGYDIDAGIALYDQFGSPIKRSSSLIEYDNIKKFELGMTNYTILPFGTSLPVLSCVYYSNDFIRSPTQFNLPNGVIISKTKSFTMVANVIELNNISLSLLDGTVFCDSSGILSSTPNNKFFCKVGEYSPKDRKLSIHIKDQEYIL